MADVLPVFCTGCGRRLKLNYVRNSAYLTCPKHWFLSVWAYIRHGQDDTRHSNIFVGEQKVPALFDPVTGARL